MKVRKNYDWLIICSLFCISYVNSDEVIESSKNLDDIPKNETISDLFKIQFSDYLKLFCDIGFQILVSEAICAKQLEYICKRNEVLFQMLDASSKYSGVLYGQRFDFGNYDQCLDIDHQYEYGRLMGKFCPLSLLIPDPQTGFTKYENIFKLSICIPNGCPLKIFSNFSDGLNEELITQMEATCVTKESGKELGIGNIMTMAFFMVWVGIVMICTIYEIYSYAMEKDYGYQNLSNFSLVSNFKKLFEIKGSSKDHIQIFDGIRAISMIWIIAAHGYSVWIDRLPESTRGFEKYKRRIVSSHISGAHLAVDSFFYISGFLVTLNYLKSEAKPLKQQIHSIPSFYLKRYIRITLSLLLVFLFGVWIFPKIGNGPVWIPTTKKETDTCIKYWWTFFLYIQNYYNYDELCIVPTWYLSADMQLYIFSPIVLIPLSILLKQKRKTILSMVLLVMLNILLTILPIIINYNVKSDNTFDTHSRIIDYTLGITMAVLMYKVKDTPYLPFITNKKLKKITLLVWATVLLGMYFTVLLYQPSEYTTNRNFQVLFAGLSKPVWCIGLCWIIYSCHYGYGGFINWILTRDVFKFLSKMSYIMYLLHFPVIGHFAMSLRTRIFFSNYHEFYLFCGYFVETLLVSILWTLVIDYPLLALEKHFLRKNVVKKDTK